MNLSILIPARNEMFLARTIQDIIENSDKTTEVIAVLGGKSFQMYGFKWTELLKHSIRTRDCFVCQICKKNGWIVHHIDYNKRNCNPDNLITLCRHCHMKTNFHREYWIEYFNTYE